MQSTPKPGPNENSAGHADSETAAFGTPDPADAEGRADSMTPPSTHPIEAEQRLPKIVNFDTLARCGDEIWIENGGQIYRLRRTKQGKLILTK